MSIFLCALKSIKYLRDIKKREGQDLLLYLLQKVEDDEIMGKREFPIEFYFISNLDGSNFQKLTPEGEIHRSSKMMGDVSRFYLFTYKDVNKNGKFDSKDDQFYYYIDFKKDPFKIVEYTPLMKGI